MNTTTRYIALLFAMSVILPTARVSAQEPAEPRFKASTTAVVVDVVVRDKQQRPVAGLTANDFTVFEDGKRQEITSFAAVGGQPAAVAVETARHGHDPDRGAVGAEDPPFVAALVFEQLGLTPNSL